MGVIKGFFFDLDDTLIGTAEANFQAYRSAFEDFGIAFTRDDFKKTWGKDSRHFVPELAPHLSEDDIKDLRQKKSEYYNTYLDQTKPNQELIAFLKVMAPHHDMVLVTTAKRRNGTDLLRHHNLKPYFTHTIFGDDVRSGKPNPEGYLLALKKTNLTPNEVVVFEDSDHGIAAAEAAGLSVIRIRKFA